MTTRGSGRIAAEREEYFDAVEEGEDLCLARWTGAACEFGRIDFDFVRVEFLPHSPVSTKMNFVAFN